MPSAPLMFKTVSNRCNLSCAYCYYRESAPKSNRTTDRALLEKLIPEYLDYIADTGEASFSWQGGEPTLAGLEFYEWVVDLEARHANPGTVLDNDIQTNGILVDDAFADFFKHYNFLVGVSLDGPEAIHNTLRRDSRDRGSFAAVMQGVNALRRFDVETNILTVIGPHNVRHPETLMRFFEAEGFSHVQLIPAMNFQATAPSVPATFSVTPEQYGELLVRFFDIWHRGGKPRISVRIFDDFLRAYQGLDSSLCVHGNRCDSGLVVESDGQVYPCDFYIHSDFSLGNAKTKSLQAIAEDPRRRVFLDQKRPAPASCDGCRWQPICNGGCTRARMDHGTDYFCASYQMLLEKRGNVFEELAGQIQKRRLYLSAVDRGVPPPGRNDPCLCGSGTKHKNCCGNPARSASYLFQRD